MTAAVAMTLPGSRVVQGWWRDCSSVQPSRLWFAHLLLCRIEVLVEASSSAPLAALAQALLPLLPRPGAAFQVDSLAAELHLDRTLLVQLLHELARGGAVRSVHANTADTWEVTVPSPAASLTKTAPTHLERRSFFFTVGEPPRFLPLAPRATTPIAPPPPNGFSFDLAVLHACGQQSAEWKARIGFPEDVLRVVDLGEGGKEEDWRRVPVVRAEQAQLVVVQTAAGLLGFPVRAEGWSVETKPVLSVPGGVEALSPLFDEVGLDAWKQSWQAWCQQRSIPVGEAEACKLELSGHRLLVRAPGRLIDRLRASRSDALKGEAWLLAGSSPQRSGAGEPPGAAAERTSIVRATAMIDLGETARELG
jgi:hypothetical protein